MTSRSDLHSRLRSELPSDSRCDPDPHHDHGLSFDLQTLQRQAQRRRTLLRFAALGPLSTLPLIGCGSGAGADGADGLAAAASDSSGTASSGSTSSGSTSSGSTSSSGSTTTTCSTVPEETAGPYPGDGSNTSGNGVANALTLAGIVRSDIRSSISGASGVAAGVPLTLKLQLLDSTGAACGVLAGYAIYLWHCDRAGQYSMYSSAVVNENYLRGVQATDATGTATFVTVFPGCYDGRMPHMHFEVYRSLASATVASNKLRTSQLAFPTDICRTVYSTASGYSASLTNLGRISFATDNVFSDGYSLQMTSLTGNVSDGYVATVSVAIAA